MNIKFKRIIKQVVVLLAALVGALLVGALFFLLAKSDPIKAYGVMFSGPVHDKYGITETLVRAVPLLLVGLGITEYLHSKLLEARSNGIGVLLISEDLEELLSICDNIAVLYEGRVMKVMPVEETNERILGLLMAGIAEEAS